METVKVTRILLLYYTSVPYGLAYNPTCVRILAEGPTEHLVIDLTAESFDDEGDDSWKYDVDELVHRDVFHSSEGHYHIGEESLWLEPEDLTIFYSALRQLK